MAAACTAWSASHPITNCACLQGHGCGVTHHVRGTLATKMNVTSRARHLRRTSGLIHKNWWYPTVNGRWTVGHSHSRKNANASHPAKGFKGQHMLCDFGVESGVQVTAAVSRLPSAPFGCKFVSTHWYSHVEAIQPAGLGQLKFSAGSETATRATAIGTHICHAQLPLNKAQSRPHPISWSSC
jgi:hypothetical protein